MSKYVTYVAKNVKALYPRINQPYRFDNAAKKSIPCHPADADAKYELNFVMTEDQARSLYNAMNAAFTTAEERDNTWPEKLEMPFKKNEDGNWVGKSKIAASFNGTPTKPPGQYDASNTALNEDFMLTTGSVIHIAVELYPYKYGNSCGISLRLRAVQVIDYVPYAAPSPFGKEEGFVEEAVVEEESTDDIFKAEKPTKEAEEDVIEAPVKRAKKASKEDTPPASSKLSDIIDEWGTPPKKDD